MIVSFLLLFSVFDNQFAAADINQQINYQGKLTDSSNVTVADGLYSMQFNLYTTPSGGSPIWTENRSGGNQVSVTSGLFSIMLGSVTPFTGVNFNQTLYLGVTISGDSEMTPRKILGAVPGAIEAYDLGGASSTQYLRSDQAGTLSASSSQVALAITQTGSGDILNVINKNSFTALSVTGTGNVGIATTTPGFTLTVAGTSNFTNALNFNGNAGTSGYILQSTGSGAAPTWVATSSLGISGSLSGGTNGFLARWTSPSTLSSGKFIDDGTVAGINATSSSYTFNVQGSAGTNPFNIASSTGTSLLAVLQSGNVGIGTSTPLSTLHIQGNSLTNPFSISSSTGSTILKLISNGYLGLNENNPGQRLTISGDLTSATSSGHFSSGNVLFSQLEGGSYFGRVGVKENQFGLNNYGNTWLAKDSSRTWQAIAMSSDGKIQTALVKGGQIYISSDYGNTWTAKESSRQWLWVAMSSDGKYQTATIAVGQIFVSSDYGNTWTATGSSLARRGVAMSSDGKYQTATVNNGQLQVSSDYGNTWTAKDSSRAWLGLAMSSDGKIQTAQVNTGQMYVSTDYGNTWTAKDSSRAWEGIAMSADGKIQTALVTGGGQIYVSTDYGNTWTAKGNAQTWENVAMSADGKIQTAVADSAQIYVSTDYGNSWTAKDSSRVWQSVAMSSDGKVQTAVVVSGQIYVSNADSYLAAGNLGVATSSPIASLAITGTPGTNPFVVASSTGSQLLSLLQSGNLGVGTSTPNSLLSLSGAAPAIELFNTNASGRDWKIRAGGAAAGTFDIFDASSSSSRLSIDAAGTVTFGNASSTNFTNSGNSYLGTVASGLWNGTKIGEIYGGTNQTSYATGDILYASGANTLAKRTIGNTGDVLSVVGGVPTWVATSTLGITGGGSLSGGTNGYLARWTGASSLSTGLLLDNGTVAGVNATSSSYTFNVQGSPGVNPFHVASSTGTNIFTVDKNGTVILGSLSADPATASAGAMYYNSTSNQFRCYNTSWKRCDTTGSAQIVKSSDQSVNNTTTLQNDSELKYTMAANTAYLVQGSIDFDMSDATADGALSFTVPTGATINIEVNLNTAAASTRFCQFTTSGDTSCTLSLANPLRQRVVVTGYVLTSATAGDLQFQFAQRVATAVNSPTVHANSWLLITDTTFGLGADLAELYFSKDHSIEPGDVVIGDPSLEAGVSKSTVAYDPKVLGVVSTQPGIILNQSDIVNSNGNAPINLALAGRVPIKVSIKNGLIKAGDYLTSSDISGVAMKATHSGFVIGQALTDYNGTETANATGTVEVFLKPGFYISPTASTTLASGLQVLKSIIANNATSSAMSALDDFDVQIDPNATTTSWSADSSDQASINNLIFASIQALNDKIDNKDASTTAALSNLELKVASLESLNDLGDGQTITGDLWAALQSFGSEIVDGIAYLKNFFAEHISTQNLTIKGGDVAKTGFTIYDRATGEPLCVYFENGEMKTDEGACPDSTATSTDPTVTDLTAGVHSGGGVIITTDANNNTIIIPDTPPSGGISPSPTPVSTSTIETPPIQTPPASTSTVETTPPETPPAQDPQNPDPVTEPVVKKVDSDQVPAPAPDKATAGAAADSAPVPSDSAVTS